MWKGICINKSDYPVSANRMAATGHLNWNYLEQKRMSHDLSHTSIAGMSDL